MKKIVLLLMLVSAFVSCKSTNTGATENVTLRFLDDYTFPSGIDMEGFEIGGLSGIDYHDGKYYMVSDHPAHPRIYVAEIDISEEKIDSVRIEKVIAISREHITLKNAHLDLESILWQPETENFVLASEGSIKSGKDPMIFTVSKKGDFENVFDVPQNLILAGGKEPRNNGTFEGLAAAFDNKGIWASMELPLKTDGLSPKLIRTKSPVRVTYFDKNTLQPSKQFAYRLEPIAKIPWLYFAVNGVTGLLEYAPDKFLILERGFSAGHGKKGMTVRIFDVDATLATNTLDINNLRVSFYNPAQKNLLFDFKWAKEFLSEEIIDNIEGITFGPMLENGNPSLLLISDNNFNSINPQLNQVILMEIVLNK